ncbi:MAG: DNA-binding protein [Gammaproteobacteria bacterium]|nr:DNA-binding protein [Gammaproteobacteria bacterium]MDP2346339.1 DNA-binding protein [Gammaproteobacteria bacterium]
MPHSKILVDTNSYLRLAKTIRPLLFVPFGENEYCLYILPELNEELNGRKLKSKFQWVEEQEYVENRKHFPTVSRKQLQSIHQTFAYIWDHVQTELPGPSRIDALYIAYALELAIPLVTDDRDMTELASVFDVQVMPTL